MKFKAKFDYRKISIFIILFIFISILSGFLCFKTYKNYFHTQNQYLENFKTNERQVTFSTSLALSEMLKPNRELLIATASKIRKMDLNDNKSIQELLIEKSSGLSSVSSIYFGRQDNGKLVKSNIYNPTPVNYDARKRPWYTTAISQDNFVITNPYVNASTNRLCISLAIPIYQNDAIKGVLGLDIQIDTLQQFAQSLEYGQDLDFYIINSKGMILINPDLELVGTDFYSIFDNLNNKEEIKSSIYSQMNLNNQGTIDLKELSGQYILMSYNYLPEYDWKVVSLNNPAIVKENLKQLSLTSLSIGGLQLLFLILLIAAAYSIFSFVRKRNLHHLYTHDMLTGLPNRNFLDKIFHENYISSSQGTTNTLLLIDIDNFKFINDTLGRNVGDTALTTVASILKNCLNEDDLIIRLESDEFAILSKSSTIQKAKSLAEKLQKLVYESPIKADNYSFDLSISIGVTAAESTIGMQKFFSLADVALHTAKDQGKNKVVCLLPDESARDLDELDKTQQIKSLLKKAIKEDRFIIYLQPIMDLKEARISHYEALIRLYDDNRNLVPPSSFIPIAERFGLISSIDRWMFKSVLGILKNHPDISIFINISAVSLNDSNLLEYFEKSILESGLNPENLKLGIEITETAAAKNFSLAEFWLKRFKSLGCILAIDDFGVGYTSFAYLQALPFDFVKIDGSFVKSIDNNLDHRAIVETINTLAHTMGKKAIAEFVENESVMKILQDLGVCYGQGYYIGRPSPMNDKFA